MLRRFRKTVLAAALVVALVFGGTAVWAAVTSSPTANCTQHPVVTQTTLAGNPTGASKIKVTCTVPNPPAQTVTVTASPTDNPTSTPTDNPTPTDPPSTDPTTPTSGWDCTTQMPGNCGPFDASNIPMANGYNTYVADQPIDPHGTVQVDANSASDWQAHANLTDDGGAVEAFLSSYQLTNDWNGSGWGGAGSDDTPLNALSALKVNYDESSPQSGATYEYAPDVFQDNYGSDVMFWVDTRGRCNEGAYGPSTLGTWTDPSGATWTVHRYDDTETDTGNTGNEIIFVLNGSNEIGCATQHSGTVDIKAGLQWLVDNGFESGPPVVSLIQTGWEVTSAADSSDPFTVHNYSIDAPLN